MSVCAAALDTGALESSVCAAAATNARGTVDWAAAQEKEKFVAAAADTSAV
jgi:hypothetical protein